VIDLKRGGAIGSAARARRILNTTKKMGIDQNSAEVRVTRRVLRQCAIFSTIIMGIALAASLVLPRGLALATLADCMQPALMAAATVLCFQNFRRTQANERGFWFLLGLGSALWLVSLLIWSTYELAFRIAVPDVPIGDIFLFVKMVPFIAAVVLEPQRKHDSRFRAFGFLDITILILYSLYLYAFCVFAYRMLPGAKIDYDYQFNLVDAIANQVFVVATAVALFRSSGTWGSLYRLYFFSAATYCLASDINNVAIDLGKYYSGSLFDLPLVAAMLGFLCVAWVGRSMTKEAEIEIKPGDVQPGRPEKVIFFASHLAMVVTLSTPAMGFWLLMRGHSSPELFQFRLMITLGIIFMLTLLLSIKQHLLAESLIGSLQRLSEMYTKIQRLEVHLDQSEKLAALGELVAKAANQIKTAMSETLERAAKILGHAHDEERIPTMAGKIGQYAQRTDALVENMLQFAQETPMRIAPLELKPLMESAVQLSRVGKQANLKVEIHHEDESMMVLGDSGQLLHVFLQIIANAIDALGEKGGGTLDISIRKVAARAQIEFADSGPGIREPEHVFEPFYTTKEVGKGTGLGLSTCYGIIQQHDGDIFCSNRAEGGALFTITLPGTAMPAGTKQNLPVNAEVAI
jgi:signal transduction histidine kinase